MRELHNPPRGVPIAPPVQSVKPVKPDHLSKAERAGGLISSDEFDQQAATGSPAAKMTGPISRIVQILGEDVPIQMRRCTREDILAEASRTRNRAKDRAENAHYHSDDSVNLLHIIANCLEDIGRGADPEPTLMALAVNLENKYKDKDVVIDESIYMIINIIRLLQGSAMVNDKLEKCVDLLV